MINRVGSMFGSMRDRCDSVGVMILALVLILAFAFGFDCLIVWLCMALWNGCLVTAIPVFVEVGFWQMWGIYLLCSFLVKASVSTTKE